MIAIIKFLTVCLLSFLGLANLLVWCVVGMLLIYLIVEGVSRRYER